MRQGGLSSKPKADMPDFRVHLAQAPAPEATELPLTSAETHHLVNVNRARLGDPVTAFDGRGAEWICRLDRVDGKKTAVLRVLSATRRPPLPCSIILGQGLPKGGTMDDIVRQATELGATLIAPLATTRSEVHLDADRAGKKLEKWRTAAIEAAKQCGNPFLPKIDPVRSLAAFLPGSDAHTAELRLVASLHPGARPLRAVLGDFRKAHDGRAPRSAAWLIGPEGDLTKEEVDATLAAGWIPVTLGPLVLRCDTAAAYALSALRCETET
jgi:16S rRNA (uracil1498-N3)-methyltransferase